MTKNIRQIRIEDKVAYIPLTQGYEAMIDAEDVPLVENYKWHISKKDRRVYVKTTIRINDRQRPLRLHRLIMNPPEEMMIDHINGNCLDNRRSNLRIATNQQNQYNKDGRNNKTGYKGVYLCKKNQRYISSITVRKDNQSKLKHLGYFNTPEEAYAAYCKAAQEIHGEYIHSTVASSVLHKD